MFGGRARGTQARVSSSLRAEVNYKVFRLFFGEQVLKRAASAHMHWHMSL